MKKIPKIIVLVVFLSTICYITFVYFATYSEGIRTGQLAKFSQKGTTFKTWEGEMNQGTLGTQIFIFSVMDKDQKVIDELKNLEGQNVELNYIERYRTFPWWGESKYFVTGVEKDSTALKTETNN